MNLHQLRVFLAVSEAGSFSAAARTLYLTQPAVSLHIRALETSLGVKLFDRSGGHLALTPGGHALIQAATTMLHAEDEARRALDALRGVTSGKVVVAANTTGGMYVLPRILRAFRAAHPHIELVLEIDTTDAICERVNHRVIDLGLVGGPVEDRRLTTERLIPDDVVLIVSPEHPLALQPRLRVADLAEQRLIVPEERSRTRRLVERHLREAGLSMRPAMQLMGTEAVKKAVESNLGIAFVSAYAVEREVQYGDLCQRTVDGFRITRWLVLVHRSQKQFTPAAAEVRRFVLGWAAQQTLRAVRKGPGA